MRNRQPTRNRQPRRGATLLETAIVLPLVLTALLGLIEFGALFFVRHNLVHAARQGARELAVRDGDATSAETAVRDALTTAGIKMSSLQVSATSPSPNSRVRDVRVSVSVLKSQASLGDPLRIMGQGRLQAEVVMRKEGGF